jgi:hypothetical protein
MGGADHTGNTVGEQHRRAIGSRHSEQKAGPVGDHAVGTRPVVVRPGLMHLDDIGRVDLVDRRELCIRQDRGNRAAPVLGDGLHLVCGAVADVEPGDRALRNTAAPAEKAVGEPCERLGADDLDGFSQGCA